MIYSESRRIWRHRGAAAGAARLTGKERSMASPHLETLSARHATLDGQIAAEMLRPLPDNTRISRLKRQKLRLKEEVTGLKPGG